MITPSFGLTATERVLPKLALDFTTASLDPRVTFTRTTDATNPATYINNSGYVTAATNNQPRFDYNPITLACKGLLIEESRTNLLSYSQDFSNAAWSVTTNITVATSATIDPAGGTGAYSITAGAASATFGRTITGTAGLTYTYSFWVRRKTGTGGVTVAVGDGNFQSISAQVSSVWNRVSVASIATSTTTIRAYIAISVSGDALEIYGAQLEQASFATSYIPTTTTALTRNADVATMTGTNFSDWWSATNGASDIWLIPKSTSTLAYMSFDDNTANNKIVIANSTTSGQSTITSGGVLQATLTAGTITANAINKVGCSWNTNNCAATANAITPATTASATIPSITQLRIGSNGSAYANAWVQKLFYWSQRITNNEIQAFTK